MLEEDKGPMEKKGSTRQSSVPPPKCSSGSSDKKNDNSNKFPRNNRNREPTANGRGGPDNGTRKPAPQKSRSTSDKRPRSRTSNLVDRQREEVAGNYMIEDGSNYRSKKRNLNHLLTFSLAPREVDTFVGGNVHRTKTNRVRFDKKKFLHANCQFIVKDTGDYSPQSADPDLLVDWELVELVRLYSVEKPLCPICLDSPIAAKVTLCGHIYCWSCILHLLSLEDDTWSKCPICDSPIVDKDLRSAEAIVLKPYKIGDKITMKLMKRERGSTYSVPRDEWLDRYDKLHCIQDDEKLTRYMKLLVAGPGDILSHVIYREKISLETQLVDTEVSEVCFIETAQRQLKEREDDLLIKAEKSIKKRLKKDKAESVLTIEDLEEPEQLENVSPEEDITRRVKTLSISSASDDYPLITAGRFKTFSESSISDPDCSSEVTTDLSLLPESPPVLSEECQGAYLPDIEPTDFTIPEEPVAEPQMSTEKMSTSKRKNKPLYSTKSGYFWYQAENGQQIYMHHLNSAMLQHEFDSLEFGPNQITGTILDITWMNMTECVRSRKAFLAHLPVSTDFLMVELDIELPVLSRKTLDLFYVEIEQKKRLRQRKAKKENLRERKIIQEESQKLGIYPELNISLESNYQFPSSMMRENEPSLPSRQAGDSPLGRPTDDRSSQSLADDQPSVSFAQMLRNGPAKTPAPVWPKLSSLTPVETKLTVTKTAACYDSDGSEIEDYVPVPEYGQTFGNAIKAALDNSISTSTDKKAQSKLEGKKKKQSKSEGKKKKKSKVLFSTSMSFNTNIPS